jgi:Ser/Thr protein kinase RdoA (MazF antagonist)
VRRTGLGPDLVPTTDGRCHHAGTVVMALVEGHPPEDDEWVLVGETLERLHESTVGWPQRPGFRSSIDLLVEDRGGDVDLMAMPAPAVARCRTAWRRVHGVPTVVHGDPGRENVRIVGGRAILLDWDEARVDLPAFDLAVLPGADEPTVQAAHAWEASTCWQAEPEYARRRLAQLR